MSRYRRMRRGRVTQVQGIASRGEDFFLMLALKSPKIMVLGVMVQRRNESMGELGSVYAAVTVQLSIMLMLTLSREHEKLSIRSTILLATYVQMRGGGESGGESKNNK